MSNPLTLILAAGRGTRMKSDLTKVLHPVGGKPMVMHVIDTVRDLNSDIVCIVGHQADKVKRELAEKNINFAYQQNQLGTGHAVLQAEAYLQNFRGPVIILCGDTPLLTVETLQKLIEEHEKNDAALTVLTAFLDNPSGYGRIIKDEEGYITCIREEDDATPQEKSIKEINSGVYCFDSEVLQEALGSLDRNNAQGEYYLTDTVESIYKSGCKIPALPVEDPAEIIGINNRKDLARAEKVLRQRINDCHLKNGVTIVDPATTYIDEGVEIGRDTVIYPFTHLEGTTKIGSHCSVGPRNRVINAIIGDHVDLKSNCNIRGSRIGDRCQVGPNAYIRPGCEIDGEVKIGNYVELKKAVIAAGTKVPHLSYVGDAEIGGDTNIGAGTIFANYDGQHKHKTIVGDSVFIGSNTTLVAPVELKDGAKTGAGSVVTRDVAEDTTVVGVPARIHKTGDNNKGGD